MEKKAEKRNFAKENEIQKMKLRKAAWTHAGIAICIYIALVVFAALVLSPVWKVVVIVPATLIMFLAVVGTISVYRNAFTCICEECDCKFYPTFTELTSFYVTNPSKYTVTCPDCGKKTKGNGKREPGRYNAPKNRSEKSKRNKSQ